MSKSSANIIVNPMASNPSSSHGTTLNLSLTLQSRSPEALATYLDELAKAVRENRGSAPSVFSGVSGMVGWVK
jgi:hypothetical protein